MKKTSLALILIAVSWAIPVFAHQSPAGCTGSGLQISLFSDVQTVHIGDTIHFSANVFNGLAVGPISCDASGITASITTPDGQAHAIALGRTMLTNGQSDMYSNIVTYVARAQDVKVNGTLVATAHDTGTIHQNDTDSQGGADQSVNINVLSVPGMPPPPSGPSSGPGGPPIFSNGNGSSGTIAYMIGVSKVPNPPALTAGPGSVTYNYTVWNIGSIINFADVSLTDDKCSPVEYLSGDMNNNNKLDVAEKWQYSCTAFLSTTTANTAIVIGYSDDQYHQPRSSSATALVPVSGPALAYARVSAAAISAPIFPHTGLPPEEAR